MSCLGWPYCWFPVVIIFARTGELAVGLVRYIELPLAGGELLNLYRILWSVAWTAVIAAEMLGVSSGVGFRLLDFRYLLMYPQMFVYIFVVGVWVLVLIFCC